MKDKLDIFESTIKSTLDNHEAPYDANAWTSLSAKLGKASSPFYKTNWFRGGAAVFVVAAITIVTLWDNTPEVVVVQDLNLADNTVSVVENDVIVPVENTTEKTVELVDEKKTKKSFVIIEDEKLNAVEEFDDRLKKEQKTENSLDSEKQKIGKKVDEIKKDIVEEPVKTISLKIETPKAEFILEKEVCQSSVVVLKAENQTNLVSYSWKINDSELINTNSLIIKLEKEGVNEITLFVKDKEGKVVSKTTKEILVKEIPQNSVVIKLDKNSIVNKYDFELLNNENSIVWNFGDNEKSSKYLTSHSFKENSTYKCTYTITSKNGCSATFEKEIKVTRQYTIRTECGFSPNGDGNNDAFIPAELKFINQPFEMTIYSRNGAEIYKTNSINSPWNGNNSDGTKTPYGTYIWKVTLTNKLGVKETYKGTVINVAQ